MDNYKSSDTKLTASWIDDKFLRFKNCSNCMYIVRIGFGGYNGDLSKFCPNCGFRMKNPTLIAVDIDYNDLLD